MRQAIAERALAEGFDAIGFADPRAPWDAGERLAEFLAQGRHGDMGWMAATAERRAHPTALWPEARSAIVLALSYKPDHDPLEDLKRPGQGVISVYARGADYHDVIKKRLKAVARWLAATAPCSVKVFVDTAALMEKPLAERAGLGWRGKHTNLVSRDHGSWLFLGVILTDLVIDPDAPEGDHCGSCSACLDICPTGAFPAPRQLDARRCVSYLTIEHKGHIPADLRPGIGVRLYGCDDCLAVCPWNKFAHAPADPAFAPRGDAGLGDLLGLDDAGFRARFAGSPIKRVGRDRFLRNALIAAGNSGDPALAGRVESLLADPSPLVRAMAVWALARLAPGRWTARRAGALAEEPDPLVREEWA